MPQRFLRPGLTTSRRFNGISYEAQSLFVRILTLVDDFGRYDADPRLLRSHAFPFGDPLGKDVKLSSVERMCRELETAGLADFYETADSKQYVQLSRWQERSRSEKSKYPQPAADCKHFLRNPAESCGILPPSSSSSPSPLYHRHSLNGSGEPSRPDDAEWLTKLQDSPAYKGVDVAREHGKMVEWCRVNHKPATRRRFVNWLNRVERPMTATGKPKREFQEI